MTAVIDMFGSLPFWQNAQKTLPWPFRREDAKTINPVLPIKSGDCQPERLRIAHPWVDRLIFYNLSGKNRW
jgi:hypothetical protein